MAGKRGVAKKWSVFTRISVTARSVMLPYVILAVICGVILLPWLWWRSVLAKAIPGVPFVPPAFLLGNISFFKKYGNVPGRIALWSSLGRPDNFIIWFGPKPILSVTKAEDIKATLNHSYPFRNSTGLMMNHWKRVFGDKVRFACLQ